MPHNVTRWIVGAAMIACVPFTAALLASAQHEHPATGAHRHPAAEKLKNPVAADPASIAAGSKAYAKHCSECHGDDGKGDGMMGDDLDPKPPDLTDADWKHGSSDGEIFTVIEHGVKGTGMKAFARKLTAHQAWDVVNYQRSIGPAKPYDAPR
jgi:mono/diheme cytochrome c family protein